MTRCSDDGLRRQRPLLSLGERARPASFASARSPPRSSSRRTVSRIEQVNPQLNAVVQVDAERALEAARSADRALAQGIPVGPLHGVPFTAKDNFETAGIITAIGVAERASVVPAQDATAVARLKAAGAILLGKTNCPPWGGGSETENEVYGRTNNPYDLERSVSGSSGGEAAIIAAGGSAFGIGSDSGGSIRDPAHFCGPGRPQADGRADPRDRSPGRRGPDRGDGATHGRRSGRSPGRSPM